MRRCRRVFSRNCRLIFKMLRRQLTGGKLNEFWIDLGLVQRKVADSWNHVANIWCDRTLFERHLRYLMDLKLETDAAGVCYQLWFQLKKNSPELTLADFIKSKTTSTTDVSQSLRKTCETRTPFHVLFRWITWTSWTLNGSIDGSTVAAGGRGEDSAFAKKQGHGGARFFGIEKTPIDGVEDKRDSNRNRRRRILKWLDWQ